MSEEELDRIHDTYAMLGCKLSTDFRKLADVDFFYYLADGEVVGFAVKYKLQLNEWIHYVYED